MQQLSHAHCALDSVGRSENLTGLQLVSDNSQMKNNNKRWLAILFVILVAGAAYFFQQRIFSTFSLNPNAVIAQVETTEILGKDVAMRMKAMKALGIQVDQKAAENQLIQGLTFYEILKQNAGDRIDQLIEDETKVLDSSLNTNWKKAKSLFNEGSSEQKKALILPGIMDKLIFSEGYLKDETYHQEEKALAEKILKQALKRPTRFQAVATEFQKGWIKGKLDTQKGLVWSEPKKAVTLHLKDGLLVARQWDKAFLGNLDQDQILPQLIDEGSQWIVLKKGDQKEPTSYPIEAIVIQKKPFLSWLDENRNQIAVSKSP